MNSKTHINIVLDTIKLYLIQTLNSIGYIYCMCTCVNQMKSISHQSVLTDTLKQWSFMTKVINDNRIVIIHIICKIYDCSLIVSSLIEWFNTLYTKTIIIVIIITIIVCGKSTRISL